MRRRTARPEASRSEPGAHVYCDGARVAGRPTCSRACYELNMAGGPNARIVACLHCDARAERTSEGSEDDYYVCDGGHEFGIDWSYGGPPTEPQWPLTLEHLQQRKELRRLLSSNGV
jgi:hypothetical protein